MNAPTLDDPIVFESHQGKETEKVLPIGNVTFAFTCDFPAEAFYNAVRASETADAAIVQSRMNEPEEPLDNIVRQLGID